MAIGDPTEDELIQTLVSLSRIGLRTAETLQATADRAGMNDVLPLALVQGFQKLHNQVRVLQRVAS
tara:strand:+ start:13579 stop:13776 length:198 start_codon:yes stop_codon:yes gene_type:complete